MSLPLVDVRGKITHRTDAVLDALHLATGRDRSEIMREALDEWAGLKIHEASLIDQRLRREGGTGIHGGIEGKTREPQGAQSLGGAYLPKGSV